MYAHRLKIIPAQRNFFFGASTPPPSAGCQGARGSALGPDGAHPLTALVPGGRLAVPTSQPPGLARRPVQLTTGAGELTARSATLKAKGGGLARPPYPPASLRARPRAPPPRLFYGEKATR